MTNHHFPSDLPNYFADAEANYKEADMVLFGICYDKTASFRSGSRFGPDEIRKASWNFESYNMLTKKSIKDVNIHDYGNILIEDDDSTKQVFQKVKDLSHQIVTDGKIPVLLGGEHTFSAACVQGFPKDTFAIIFDAHLDFRDTYIDQKYNHACTIRRIVDHLPGDHIFIIGVRSGSAEEYEQVKKAQVHIVTVNDLLNQKTSNVLSEIKKKIGNNKIYMGVDIDVIDPCYAPGTGSLEPFGVAPIDILKGIELFSSNLAGFDIMEVAPLLDHGQTAILAAKLIRYTIDYYDMNK